MARKARQFRFYQAGNLSVGQAVTLDKSASHHLLKVLRALPGDQLELFNGDGYNYSAILDNGSTAKKALITINSHTPNQTESPLAITLVQAVSRGEKMDQSIRQAVELGATAVQPVFSRHAQKFTEASRLHRKQEHWHNIMISAAEQSGRARVPVLHPSCPLTAWMEDGDNGLAASPSIVLHPAASRSFGTLPTMTQVSIAIGPESGFDDDEVESMIKAGAIACHMGPRTLRTETAGPAAIAMLQAIHGDGS